MVVPIEIESFVVVPKLNLLWSFRNLTFVTVCLSLVSLRWNFGTAIAKMSSLQFMFHIFQHYSHVPYFSTLRWNFGTAIAKLSSLQFMFHIFQHYSHVPYFSTLQFMFHIFQHYSHVPYFWFQLRWNFSTAIAKWSSLLKLNLL